MPTVELVYDRDCPNVGAARGNLMRAFALSGTTPRWSEHRIGDPDVPDHARGYGSPTVLVNGRDVAGAQPSGETCCRIYRSANGGTQAPSSEQIALALSNAGEPPGAPSVGRGGVRTSLGVLPGVGFALLPKVACPACWPAYAGVLSSLGIGFLMEARSLLPVTSVFLLGAVGALAFRARRRRGLGPFFAGAVAAVIVLAGKFAFESDLAMYAGLGMLVAASIWNGWPRRATSACPTCTTQ